MLLQGVFSSHKDWLVNLPPTIAAACIVLTFHPRVRRAIDKRFSLTIAATFFVTRVCLFSLIYVFDLMKNNRGMIGDITVDGGWLYLMDATIRGQMPYRDFWSAYSVLYAQLISVLYWFWRDPRSVVVVFIALDLGSLLLLWSLAKRKWGSGAARDAALVYTLTPISWYFVVRHAQDEIAIAFFTMLALYFWERKQGNLSAVALGLGFCATTYMFALVILPFLISPPHRLRRAAVLVAVIAAVNAPVVFSGGDVLSPLRHNQGFIGTAFWHGVYALFGSIMSTSLLTTLSYPVSFAAVLYCCFIIDKRRVWPGYGALALIMVAVVFSPKSFTYYALAYAPLLAILVARSRSLALFALFSAALVALPKYFIDVYGKGATFAPLLAAFCFSVTLTQLLWAAKALEREPMASTGCDEGREREMRETV